MDIVSVLLGLESGYLLPGLFMAGRVANDNTTSYVPPTVKIDSRAISARNKAIPEEDSDDIDFPAMRDIEDRRLWRPEADSSFPAYGDGRKGRVTVRGASSRGFVSSRVGFESPALVVLCARRMARRQVMLARGFSGRLGFHRSRRGPFSSVSCRSF